MIDYLDGKQLAKDIRSETATKAEELRATGVTPTLAIVVATADEQALWYVRAIEKAAESTNIAVRLVTLPAESGEEQIAGALDELATDDSVHGILLQTPLPTGVRADNLIERIPAYKDVDGASSLSAGRLAYSLPAFAPATAAAVSALLNYHQIAVSGKHVVIVGRSRVVGRPVSQLLLQADATVTICHSKTQNLAAITCQADILVIAIGKAGFITQEYSKPDAIIIDVGTNVDVNQNMVGDVSLESFSSQHAYISPVPGGVGPVTTALLLQHVIAAVTQKFI